MTYDSLNRLSTVTGNRTGGVTNYSYDAASNVATVTYPNGVQTLFHYDALNRAMGATTQQTGYIYQRGPTGNLTSVMDANGRTVNWSYDGIYRLTGETISLDPAEHNGSVGYGLDPVGNRVGRRSFESWHRAQVAPEISLGGLTKWHSSTDQAKR